MIDATLLMQAVLNSRDGITISDPNLPDNPLIFVNPAFEKMTGYSSEEIINRNCRFLQANHKIQRNLLEIKDAIQNAKNCLVTIQNYRKDGSMFWNELSISPVFDFEGKLTHFIGIQKDVTSRVHLEQYLQNESKSLHESKARLENLVIHDYTTGIFNHRYFETELKALWKPLVDSQSEVTLMMLDIDNFKKYNDIYGHIAGNEVLKKVAHTLTSSMKRATDFVARFGGEEFVVLTINMTDHEAIEYGQALCLRIQELNIVHEASLNGVLTISCGLAHVQAGLASSPAWLLNRADKALYAAKSNGRNQAVIYNETLHATFPS